METVIFRCQSDISAGDAQGSRDVYCMGRDPYLIPGGADKAVLTDASHPVAENVLDFATKPGYKTPVDFSGITHFEVSLSVYIPHDFRNDHSYLVWLSETVWLQQSYGKFTGQVSDGAAVHTRRKFGLGYQSDTWYDLSWFYGASDLGHRLLVDGAPEPTTEHAHQGSPQTIASDGYLWIGNNGSEAEPFRGLIGPNIEVRAWSL